MQINATKLSIASTNLMNQIVFVIKMSFNASVIKITLSIVNLNPNLRTLLDAFQKNNIMITLLSVLMVVMKVNSQEMFFAATLTSQLLDYLV